MLNPPFFKVIQVPLNAAEIAEQLGTKYKFWYHDKDFGSVLFKEGRPGTGENWAEKIACELANELGLPHAHYELAECGEKKGVMGVSLVAEGARLVHGNELLSSYATNYAHTGAKFYRSREHTLRRVVGYFKASSAVLGPPYGFQRTEKIRSALDVFVGYLMFDAWIANQDRHDQNWAVLRAIDGKSYLAATFDHGSSMGRNEDDKKRELMLTTKDVGQQISTYVCKARSALYPSFIGAKKSLTTLEAFALAAVHAPSAAIEWSERLVAIKKEGIDSILHRMPEAWMSATTKKFTKRLLELNCDRIHKVVSSL